jgi:5'-nucleotidase
LLILLTNDDGLKAEGLTALKKELKQIAEVWVVAPEGEQSAISHSLTLQKPLEVKKMSNRTFSINGTPADAVTIGVYGILKKKPDLLVSGINHGPNLGEDVTYSGTVAGAMEGSLMGIPSIAVSAFDVDSSNFKKAARFVKRIALFIQKKGLPRGTFLNINIPVTGTKLQKYEITRLGRKIKRKVELKKVNFRNRDFWWIGKENTDWSRVSGTDWSAIKRGKVSITPLQLDLTDYEAIDQIRTWKLR